MLKPMQTDQTYTISEILAIWTIQSEPLLMYFCRPNISVPIHFYATLQYLKNVTHC